LDKLYTQLRKVRKDGYSTNEAETFNYVYGVGAPILDKQNIAIAAISLSGTKSTINVKNIPMLAERTILTAHLIAKEISKN
jgi:DNA-binding IclR family transcriptional regulator